MNVSQQIEHLLLAHLAPVAFSVTDDSAKHAGHAGARAGGQSHFSVMVVSEKFVGLNQVARHRLVYATLKPLLDAGLHALAIEAKTPDEA
jgi:BolA protein